MINVMVGLQSSDTTELCTIGLLDKQTQVTMQCRQKRYDIFLHLLWFFTGTLGLHALVNTCSVCWGLPSTGLRQISGLMREIQEAIRISKVAWPSIKVKKRKKGVSCDIELGANLPLDASSAATEASGEDFLFLFDLISCTCGKAATLRVLSYTSPSFEQLCQPRILHQQTSKTESSIKITWNPARLQDIRRLEKLEVAEYVATIFPGHNWKTLPDNWREVEFRNLVGGTTEYTITVSAIVGNAKMKGVAIKQFLPPFPPQNLTVQSLEMFSNKQITVKISWTPPRGDFHKYSLRIFLVNSLDRQASHGKTESNVSSKLPDETWLPRDTTEHLAEGLKPGERYRVELRSMTAVTRCLVDKTAVQVVLTRPLPPTCLTLTEGCDQVEVVWSPPPGEGHSSLVGFTVQLKSADGNKLEREEFVERKAAYKSVFRGLTSTREYMVAVTSVCQHLGEEQQGVLCTGWPSVTSHFLTRTFVTQPRPPTNLRLESCQTTGLRVRWDPATDCASKPAYNLMITPLHSELAEKMEGEAGARELDSTVFSFSRLAGTGQPYTVCVETVVVVAGKSYFSSKIQRVFLTRPLPPDQLVVQNSKEQRFGWRRSQSQGVRRYKFKIREEEERATDFIVEDTNPEDLESSLCFTVPFTLRDNVEFKINIYSVAEHGDQVVESEACHAKVSRVHSNSLLRGLARLSVSMSTVSSTRRGVESR